MRRGDKYYLIAFVLSIPSLLGIWNMDLKTYFKVVCGTVLLVEVAGFAWMWITAVADSPNSDNVDD